MTGAVMVFVEVRTVVNTRMLDVTDCWLKGPSNKPIPLRLLTIDLVAKGLILRRTRKFYSDHRTS
jgi:hypothetical protein